MTEEGSLMTLKFDSAGIAGMGTRSDVEGKLGCTVVVRLQDDRGDHEYANVEVDVLVDSGSDITLGNIRAQARGEAITALKTALELLENNSLEELRTREREQDEERDRRMEDDLKASLTGIFPKV
jgi:hypothetical protein